MSEMENNKLEIKDQKIVAKLSIIHVIVIFSVKLITSFFTNSLSFYAELSDSILDFVAVTITFVALKESRKPADLQHMYGHYKINSFAGFIQSLLIIGLYFSILYNSSVTLIFHANTYTTVNGLGVAISLLAILTIVLIDSTKIVSIGKKSQNTLIIAQGANFRGDLFRNISVIIGLFLASFGLFLIDIILAIIFSVKSLYEGIGVMRKSFNELIDVNMISEDIIDEIKTKISQINGITKLNKIAFKTIGKTLDADVLITMDIKQSLYGSHYISSQIREIVAEKCPVYECNTMIEYNIDNSKNVLQVQQIIAIIRELVDQEPQIRNLHNFYLDEFIDGILIQYHVNVDPTTSLSAAHTLVTQLEEKIQKKIHESINISKILKILTHIEPLKRAEKTHPHVIFKEIPPEYQQTFNNLLIEIPDLIFQKK